jgi:8-oxo-dGTP pyrophosphatase MutT (NUDIX family)
LHHKSLQPPIRRGVIAVVPRNDRLLVIRRAEGIAAPGMLCFPGGGIEKEESETEALIRELREELNVDVRPVRPLWKSQTAWRVALSWWLTEIDDDAPLVPNPEEVAAVYWHSLEELSGLTDLLSSNHDFLAALARGEFDLEMDVL